MRLLLQTALAGALAFAPAAGFAHDFSIGDITVDHPWSRATPPGAPAAGGYMTIENLGTEPDRLTGGSSPEAARFEIHEMTMDGDVMRMRPVEGGLEIPPGEGVTLEPGGYHVMFVAPARAFAEGDEIPATLTFERAGDVEVVFEVEAAGTRSSGPGHEHGDGHAH